MGFKVYFMTGFKLFMSVTYEIWNVCPRWAITEKVAHELKLSKYNEKMTS